MPGSIQPITGRALTLKYSDAELRNSFLTLTPIDEAVNGQKVSVSAQTMEREFLMMRNPIFKYTVTVILDGQALNSPTPLIIYPDSELKIGYVDDHFILLAGSEIPYEHLPLITPEPPKAS